MSSKNCPVCNASVPDGAAFCPNCGANLQSPTPSTPNQYPQYQAQQPTQPTPTPPPPPQQPQRPTGVVILTILEVIAAVYTLFAGAAAGTLLAFGTSPSGPRRVIHINRPSGAPPRMGSLHR
ncbi:hypothetical protein B9Q04_18575 [Candidatus Marsarchaeota G2 archaeon BE_D]|uniref:Zinc-ribbon domain-containing protein n=1 Tax=Candidatus Marsarchaeota G2 archaeon BE_D TaxID=1978158 RepID=A0A2R6C566_9ARCH|nr:MAG: hypothetical protein B9Q04_18575 [Candidatus Marsarchaeota G2 archaeon BE_D]